LTSNAVRHGTPGSPVRVRLTGDEQRVAVEVNNQGTIPTELLPRIFAPFRSGRHYSTRGDGLGLGRFFAKAIARAWGRTRRQIRERPDDVSPRVAPLLVSIRRACLRSMLLSETAGK
jgi:signal transduction histidine kinase